MVNTPIRFSEQHKRRALLQEKNARSKFSKILVGAYRVKKLRNLCLSLCDKLEGDRFFSKSLRDILERYHGVKVGPYSYGPCLIPTILPAGSVVGSYCSFGAGLRVFRRNHPGERLSQHPFFYNSQLGLVAEDTVFLDQQNPLIIGHDVWIGSRVTILPGCRSIGNGAMIGAGSVLTKDVESFTLVAGNPAKLLKHRYTDDIQALVNKSRWWEKSLHELLDAQDLLVSEINVETLKSYLLNTSALDME